MPNLKLQSPKISIIMPVYNVAPFVAKALQSCVEQSFKDIEIICVDDCGQDESMDIVASFARKDERIRIVRNKQNLGLLHARFEGAKIARGEYIMFLDSDDFLDSRACEIALKASENGYFDVVSLGYIHFEEENGGGYKELYRLHFENADYTREEFFKKCLKYYSMNWHIWGRLIKKKSL